MRLRGIVFKAMLFSIIIIAIICIAYTAFLALKINMHNTWQEKMLSYGPWSSQAIWASEGHEIYLDCEKEPEVQLTTPVAYISTDTGQITCIPELHYGSKTLDFNNENREILFTCKVDLVGEKTLKLYDIEIIAPALTSSSIQGTKVIYLSKISTVD